MAHGDPARQPGRRCGLSFACHRSAVGLAPGRCERAPAEQKLARWRTVVGPVFQGIWPLDVELQTSAATFKLVQILLATGDAFPEAADIIIPFIRPDDPREQATVFSIAEAPDALF